MADIRWAHLLYTLGLSTVKYIYGPATAASSSDAVIGSSISGRIEAGICIGRLTTITMPMKGKLLLLMKLDLSEKV